MRAATRSTPNVSLTTRAAMMFELSPLLTAAKASACSIPAWMSTSRSKPIPLTRSPLNDVRSRRNASGSRSIIATVIPRSSRIWASVEPTRPQPIITICTIVPSSCPCAPRSRYSLTCANATLGWACGASRVGTRARPGQSKQGARVTDQVKQDDQAGLGIQAGDSVEVTLGEAAHGGWCVARLTDGRVIFVRHGLPGEQVRAQVTDVTSHFARADAVEIITASPDRVPPPCPQARPGGCGGCDWQHASLPAQRTITASVIAQQLQRLAGLEWPVTVEPLPGDDGGGAGGGLE